VTRTKFCSHTCCGLFVLFSMARTNKKHHAWSWPPTSISCQG